MKTAGGSSLWLEILAIKTVYVKDLGEKIFSLVCGGYKNFAQ